MVEIYTYKGVSVYWPLSVLCVFVCVPLVIRYQGSTCVDPLSKIAHQMCHDHPFTQRNRTTERTVGVGVGSDGDVREGGGLHKI